MDARNIKIDGLVFDRANYDADGDVLYLVGVTIINARRLLDRDGHLTITLPHAVRVDARDLAGALS
jgi:hypothetical protein